MIRIDIFYTLASQSSNGKELKFPTKADAIRFRLRIYNHRRSNKELPELTILLRDTTLIAGPKGFDIAQQIMDISPELLKEMEAMEAVEFEDIDKHLLEVQARVDARNNKGLGWFEEARSKPVERNNSEAKAPINPYEIEGQKKEGSG